MVFSGVVVGGLRRSHRRTKREGGGATDRRATRLLERVDRGTLQVEREEEKEFCVLWVEKNISTVVVGEQNEGQRREVREKTENSNGIVTKTKRSKRSAEAPTSGCFRGREER